ncbi:hypothetical protein AYJ08_22060 [Brevibacillus sp. SKDU10]|nr:hypothetical protein AYJ08_22060 [Brevibacillus sp. SKDU10]
MGGKHILVTAINSIAPDVAAAAIKYSIRSLAIKFKADIPPFIGAGVGFLVAIAFSSCKRRTRGPEFRIKRHLNR